jgi:hypothetical protein
MSRRQLNFNTELQYVFPYLSIFAGRCSSTLKAIWKLRKPSKQHFSTHFEGFRDGFGGNISFHKHGTKA